VIPLDEILESLDLSSAEPGAGFLAALFSRFNARVPFENASKIVRNAEVSEEMAKPRAPEVFWADHLRHGTGGTCFARTAAFESLLASLGFRTHRVLGRVQRDGDHAALMVETPAGESIVDVGFPLPAILPARTGAVATPLGEIFVTEQARGFGVAFRDGVPEGPRSLEIFSEPVPDERFNSLWRETFRPGARFLRGVQLRRDLENRVVSFAAGEVRVDDLHSRLRVRLPEPLEAALAGVFGIDAEVLSCAFAVSPPGASGASEKDATLTSYFPVSAAAPEAFDAIGTPRGYRRLIEGVAEIVHEEGTHRGYRFRLGAPSGAEASGIEEEVEADSAALRVAVVRRQGEASTASSYGVLERGGRTYLVREAVFRGAREDLLRNDSLRGRLAGSLALDLLAWARLL
jgi:hypothetical protein